MFLCKFSNCFTTSDLQFGFKSNHSTTSCTFVLQEVVNHFTQNGSNVYTVLLDASKAFDRVHYVKLFRLLLHRDLNPIIIRFLLNLYTNQKLCVQWGNHSSDYYNVSNGVKQGGVLSPVLFSIYIDELLLRLRNANIGCYIGNIFMGALAYADDVALLAPTVSSMNLLLSICQQFSTDFNVQFNSNKSRLLMFGNNIREDVNVTFMGSDILKVSSEKHLGYMIGDCAHIKVIDNAIADIQWRTNMLISQFKFVPHDILYKLFKSFCLHLYGCPLWDISDKEVARFFTCWRKCIRRLLGIPNTTHCKLLPLICLDSSVEFQIHNRMHNFMKKCITSNNCLINMCFKMALNGSSRSSMNRNISYLSYTYKVNRYRLTDSFLNKKHTNTFADHYHIYASIISEVLFMRVNAKWNDQFLNETEIDHLLYDLCVKPI